MIQTKTTDPEKDLESRRVGKRAGCVDRCMSDKLWNSHKRLYSSRNKGSLGKPTLPTTDSSLQEARDACSCIQCLENSLCVWSRASSLFLWAIWEFRGNMNSWAFHNILIVISYLFKTPKKREKKSKQKCVHRSAWISYQIDLSQMSHILS